METRLLFIAAKRNKRAAFQVKADALLANIPTDFEFDLGESVIYISFAKFFAYLLKDCKSVGQ